jgi:hypothetical protein
MPDDCKVFTDASQPTAKGCRVMMLRPRESLRGGKAGGPEAEVDKEEDDADCRYRLLTNIIGMALIAILIGMGVWLTHAISMAARPG